MIFTLRLSFSKITNQPHKQPHKVTFHLLHLSKFVNLDSVEVPHHPWGSPGLFARQETSGETDRRHIRRFNWLYFWKKKKKEWRLQCLPGRASWQFNLPWKPMAMRMSVISKGWSGRRGKAKPKPSPCWLSRENAPLGKTSNLNWFRFKGQAQNFTLSSPSGKLIPFKWALMVQTPPILWGGFAQNERTWLGTRCGTCSAWRGTGELYSPV